LSGQPQFPVLFVNEYPAVARTEKLMLLAPPWRTAAISRSVTLAG
jgi:hypothetical protein